ncbi:MAG: flagellar hook-basal body complex protein FliE [Alphaproteobacteria bacterium]|nr:flagellar hook-basal body complex protein FliE [Alphaproteobacteria bacterium]MBV9694994.1 flagellar hook-basal body complex protein FliE [Alphaproteobacteria bacterium]
MTPTPPIMPIGSDALLARLTQPQQPLQQVQAAHAASFSSLLTQGVDAVNQKALDADSKLRAFALDDSIPVHQVTYALSQAQLSLELMIQMRTRLVEGYQQLMNMQL